MSKNLTVEIKNLADQVVRYLEKHKHAADTLEGIAKWWVMQQRIDEEISKVEQALEYLCCTGVLGKRVLSDGSTIYLRNRDADETLAT